MAGLKLLITGGSSYLGQHLVEMALAGGYELAYTFFSHNPLSVPAGHALDTRDGQTVLDLVTAFRPQVILHLAGSNRPAGTMDSVIRQGAANICQAAGRVGSRLIHLSTDVIFDGRQAPYREGATPSPIHAYGQAKAFAETVVADYPNHVIVRTSLIYGLQRMDRGTAWMAQELLAARPVTLFTNQFRNPIWVDSLAAACLELAGMDYRGILHVAGRERLSRADFGLLMLDHWHIQQRQTLQLGLSDLNQWPGDCTLVIEQATGLLQTPLPGVREVLKQHEPS